MREIQIHIHSNLYKIYRNSLSKWEYAPTRTNMSPFAYAIFLHLLKKLLRFKVPTVSMLFGLIALMSFMKVIPVIVSIMPHLSSFVWDIIPLLLGCSAIAVGAVMSAKEIYNVLAKRIIALVAWAKGKLTLPTIKFIGHPESMYEIERISK